MAALAYAHGVEGSAPAALSLHWNAAPDLPILLSLGLLAYGLSMRRGCRLAAPRRRVCRPYVLSFSLGIVLLYGTLASPLDTIGERWLFSVHMVQHLLLIYPVPILLLRGLPGWLFDPLLRHDGVTAVLKCLTSPIVAAAVFHVVLGVWHIPGFYEWALRDRLVHNLEHLTFLLAALVMWWPLLSPATRCPRPDPGVQLLYVLALAVGQLPVFAYITFARDVRYPTYATAARLVPLSPLEDQQLGSLLMHLVSMLVFFTVLAVVVWRWYNAEEEGDRRLFAGYSGDKP